MFSNDCSPDCLQLFFDSIVRLAFEDIFETSFLMLASLPDMLACIAVYTHAVNRVEDAHTHTIENANYLGWLFQFVASWIRSSLW